MLLFYSLCSEIVKLFAVYFITFVSSFGVHCTKWWSKYAQCGTLPILMFKALYVITIKLFFNLQLFLLCLASTSGL